LIKDFIRSLAEDLRAVPCGFKDLRKFGYTMAVVCGLVAAYLFFKRHQTVMPLGLSAVAAALLLLALVRPLRLKLAHRAWMGLAVLIGFFVSRALLSALFFFAITPISLFLKFRGKDILSLKPSADNESYWTDHSGGEDNKQSYERQY
jgi:chromate transport protein ChrA